MFEVSFSKASRLNTFFLFVSALLRLVHWFLEAWYRVRFMLNFLFICLFFLRWERVSEVSVRNEVQAGTSELREYQTLGLLSCHSPCDPLTWGRLRAGDCVAL